MSLKDNASTLSNVIFLISTAMAIAFLTFWLMLDNQASILTNILCMAVLVPSLLIMSFTGYRVIQSLLTLRKIEIDNQRDGIDDGIHDILCMSDDDAKSELLALGIEPSELDLKYKNMAVNLDKLINRKV